MTFGLVAGTVFMSILMSILNYYVFLPAYTIFMGMSAMSAPEARQYVTMAILPFNLIKGVLITFLFMLLFSRMQTWIDKQRYTKMHKNIEIKPLPKWKSLYFASFNSDNS